MKRQWMIVMLLGLIAGNVGLALAAESAASQKTAPASATSVAEGSIAAIDLQAKNLQLQGANNVTWMLKLDPNTTSVWQDGKMGNLAQLKAGEKAKVRFVTQDGQKVAKSISIQS